MTIYQMFEEIKALPSFADVSVSITTSHFAQFEIDGIRPDGMTYNSSGLTIVRYGTPTAHCVLPDADQVSKTSNETWVDYSLQYPDGTRASVLVHLV